VVSGSCWLLRVTFPAPLKRRKALDLGRRAALCVVWTHNVGVSMPCRTTERSTGSPSTAIRAAAFSTFLWTFCSSCSFGIRNGGVIWLQAFVCLKTFSCASSRHCGSLIDALAATGRISSDALGVNASSVPLLSGCHLPPWWIGRRARFQRWAICFFAAAALTCCMFCRATACSA